MLLGSDTLESIEQGIMCVILVTFINEHIDTY